jgi:translation initiation factor eIF-2B subunit epsilon
MPPKSKKQNDLLAGSAETLQAVLIADSFDEKFQPLTQDTPRCLLPLCNIPLIEYPLETLIRSGVTEVFIICCANSQKIKQYLNNSRWCQPDALMKVNIIVANQLTSVGDALRELDSRSVVDSDFILIHGDVVSNVDLKPIVQEHNKRKEVDKHAMMTMLVREASDDHPSRTMDHQPILALDPKTKQCFHYEKNLKFPQQTPIKVTEEALFTKDPNEVINRYDLTDCFIDICSIEVPALLTENFDYHDLRTDFVQGVLTSDLLSNSFYLHVLEDKYAAKVHGPQMYEAVSQNIISRWTYPLVPDANFTAETSYTYHRKQIYMDENCQVDSSSVLSQGVVIGKNTIIETNCNIRNSVIGDNCHIKAGSVLNGAYLFSNVVLEEGTTINRSIIGNGAKVLKSTSVQLGCILGDGVIVGPDASIANYLKLEKAEEETSSELGASTNASIFQDEIFEDEDEDPKAIAQFLLSQLARNTQELYETLQLATPEDSDDENEGSEDEADTFENEAAATLQRNLEEDHEADLSIIELNSLRMSFNASFDQVRECTIHFVLKLLTSETTSSQVEKIFNRWSPVIRKFIFDTSDQLYVLELTEEFIANKPELHKLFLSILKNTYDWDIFEEEVIVEWHEQEAPESDSDKYTKLRKLAEPFVNWLQEAEEDSDDDDDE